MSEIIQYKEGRRFGDYVLSKQVSIKIDKDERSVVATLLDVGLSESGCTKDEALDNLIWFISDILNDHRNDPKPLGKRLAKQIKKLEKIFKFILDKKEK